MDCVSGIHDLVHAHDNSWKPVLERLWIGNDLAARDLSFPVVGMCLELCMLSGRWGGGFLSPDCVIHNSVITHITLQ